MTDPTFVVVITPKEIYDAVRQMSGKLDVLIEQQSHTNKELTDVQRELDETKKDYEARLRSLERARWPLPSLAAIVALASLGLTIFTAFKL